jgi:hypothetical protein
MSKFNTWTYSFEDYYYNSVLNERDDNTFWDNFERLDFNVHHTENFIIPYYKNIGEYKMSESGCYKIYRDEFDDRISYYLVSESDDEQKTYITVFVCELKKFNDLYQVLHLWEERRFGRFGMYYIFLDFFLSKYKSIICGEDLTDWEKKFWKNLFINKNKYRDYNVFLYDIEKWEKIYDFSIEEYELTELKMGVEYVEKTSEK